jgi:hypothetical protein
MKMVDLRQTTDHPMSLRSTEIVDVINISILEGYDFQTHKSPFAVSTQAKSPSTPTDEPIPVFEEVPTPEPPHLESNEPAHSYVQKWLREMQKDYGTILDRPFFKQELENVRQNVRNVVERESNGKRGREHDNHRLNQLDFDSIGIERNKTARRLKPFFEKAKTKK